MDSHLFIAEKNKLFIYWNKSFDNWFLIRGVSSACFIFRLFFLDFDLHAKTKSNIAYCSSTFGNITLLDESLSRLWSSSRLGALNEVVYKIFTIITIHENIINGA